MKSTSEVSDKSISDLINSHFKGVDKIPTGKNKTAGEHTINRKFKQYSIVPVVIILVFIVSYIWDYQEVLRILSVSGLIGYGTNWIAITMLFRPRNKRPLLGQGLIPSRKVMIAERFSRSMTENLINPEKIRDRIKHSNSFGRYLKEANQKLRSILTDDEFRSGLKEFILKYVHDIVSDPVLRTELTTSIGDHLHESLKSGSTEKYMLGLYKKYRTEHYFNLIDSVLLNIPKTLELKTSEIDDWIESIPDTLDAFIPDIEEPLLEITYHFLIKIDIPSIIAENLNNYDHERFEKLIRNTTDDQLHYIQYLGGIIGCIGGLIIWSPVYGLISLVLAGCCIYFLDIILLKTIKTD